MATTMSGASAASLKVLFTALLCAAAASPFLPRSSAADRSLIDQTCRRTSDAHLCESMLDYDSNRTRTATTARDLAAVVVSSARQPVLRGCARAQQLLDDARARGAPADPLVARCSTLYRECRRASAWALGMVVGRELAYGNSTDYLVIADDAVAALHRFPERCASLFRGARRAASPLENENTEMEEKLGVAAEIVHSLH